MLAVSVEKPGKVMLRDIPEPRPGPYEAKVRTEAACLCNGTDRKLVSGHFPGVDKYPLLLGHESVGIVEEVGEKVRNFHPGQRVVGGLLLHSTDQRYASGWGGFCGYTLASDHEAMVADGAATEEAGWCEVYEIQRVVPDDIPVAEAVLLCTWREVLAGFDDFRLSAGDDILIFGAGPVGLSFVKFASLLGLKYIGIVEPNASKRSKALAMGANEAFEPDSEKLRKHFSERAPLDAVIDAVGREDIVNAALPLIRLAGSVCVYGVLGTPCLNIEKHRGPYNFNLYIHQWPTRSREVAAQERLCAWIRQGQLSAKDFVTTEERMCNIAQALGVAGQEDRLKTLLRF